MCRIWDEVRSDSGCCYILRYTNGGGRTVFVQNFGDICPGQSEFGSQSSPRRRTVHPKVLG